MQSQLLAGVEQKSARSPTESSTWSSAFDDCAGTGKAHNVNNSKLITAARKPLAMQERLISTKSDHPYTKKLFFFLKSVYNGTIFCQYLVA
ncbi:MAG: hypothetical protein ONB48_13785 [candidate division KSB1 bacterium]|nr:hypothetical protein [candidate division KSB1 bacterium]MDZ7276498.1 hypothetical protein [candidate division KSB1 bacterium]MDZ7286721.1 hypothetical protein [candidate division KSB1 bacterium]MDZ7300268.1 hypothetical protein [candidate division KSB1 bacterium]MDZ7351268.1 hypothetical protein [candidate division KSB1 bacterium]